MTRSKPRRQITVALDACSTSTGFAFARVQLDLPVHDWACKVGLPGKGEGQARHDCECL